MCILADGVMLGFLAYCGICDIKSREIPVWLLTMYSAVTVILTVLCREENIGSRAAGFLLGVFFLGISKVTRESIGYGDSWLITLLGIYLGAKKLIWVLFLSSLVAGVLSLFILWKHHWKRGETLPFVPFLAMAFLGVVLT